jgi:hypothetical protein
MNMKFESWLAAVDKAFNRITGMSRDCWPDQDYWSMYDAGDTPTEAAIAAIENEYGEEGLEAFGLQLA